MKSAFVCDMRCSFIFDSHLFAPGELDSKLPAAQGLSPCCRRNNNTSI
jgi:hypothetical protein